MLQRVDPLLSSVVVLRQAASGIPGAAAAFVAHSVALERDLTRLSSDVIARTRVTLSLVDRVRAEIAALRADGAKLTGGGTVYAAAAARFSSRADAFTTSIRTLLARAQ